MPTAAITRADVERELLRELVAEELGIRPGAGEPAPDDWEDWLRALFPAYTRHAFADHHAELWDWGWSVELGQRPPPFVTILARGGAKSTSAEMMAVAWGARRTRRYVWYLSETQDQADDHVGNVASMLESEAITRYYPSMGERLVGKFGNSRGWRRNRLRTANGSFTVDALGLDVAARGIKLEEMRPDAMILDDLDRQTDGLDLVEKKISILTRSVLPAGSDDLTVLAVQNLIHSDGIFARLARLSDQPADFLADRIVSGPHPALLDAAYEQRNGRAYVVAGEPTWEGQGLAACQRMIDTYGLSAFKVECQHEVDVFAGGLFKDVVFQYCAPEDVPDLVRVAVWVDPAVSETDKSDSHGIQADGIAANKKLYRLFSWEGITSPLDSLRRAILVALRLGARTVGVETDQGGLTWRSVYREACRSLVEDGTVAAKVRFPSFRAAKAGAGHGPKIERASRQLAEYERGLIVHVLDAAGSYATLERSLRRFPVREPHDLTDASYWSWADLRGKALTGVMARAMSPETDPEPDLSVIKSANTVSAPWEKPGQAPAGPRRRMRLMGDDQQGWPG
jgi:hypothetical protein